MTITGAGQDKRVPWAPDGARSLDGPLGGKCRPGDMDVESQFQYMTVH